MRFSTLLVASATLALATSTVSAGEASTVDAAHDRGRAVEITSATIEAPDRFVVTFEIGSNEVVVQARGSFRLNGVRYTMLDVNGEAHVVRTAWHDELNARTFAFDGSSTEYGYLDTRETEAWLRGLGEAVQAASTSPQGTSASSGSTVGGVGSVLDLIGAVWKRLTGGGGGSGDKDVFVIVVGGRDNDITVTVGAPTPQPEPPPPPPADPPPPPPPTDDAD